MKPSHPYTIGLLNSVPRLDRPSTERLDPIEGEIPDPADLPTGCAFRPRCRWATAECEVSEPALEQVEDRQLVACYESKAVSESVGIAWQ